MMKLRHLVAAVALLITGAVMAGEPIDINSADATTLATAISGVGAKRAKAIILYRKEHGPFTSVDDLAKVRGIGQKLIDKSRDNLTVKTTGS
jgi:competence protein ComEA